MGERAEQRPGSGMGEKTATVDRHDWAACTIDAILRVAEPIGL